MVPTMDLPSAFKRLADYRTKNTRLSRQIFESGIVVYRNDAMHKLGDDRESSLNDNITLFRQRPRLMITPGWQFLESLALAAVDVGRIDVAEVSSHAPAFPSIWVFGVFHQAGLAVGVFDTLIRQIPGVSTSTMSRGCLEGGDRRLGSCSRFLPKITRRGPV
jgi:hypothetical protein